MFAGDATGPNFATTETQVPVEEQANRSAPDYADGIPGRIRLYAEERLRSMRA